MKSDNAVFLSDVPELLTKWDFDKNASNNIFPDKITLGSNKNVWWHCSKNHSWQDTVVKHVHGKPCPYCSNKRVLLGYNDLTTLYPQIAAEWDFANNSTIDINTIVPGSAKKVSWKCTKCSFIWITSIRQRTQRGTGCPMCSRKRAGKAHHEFFLNRNGSLCNSELLNSWDYEKNFPLKPEDVTTSSNLSVWWICRSCGHSWKAKISNRSHGRGCPACSNRVLIKGVNDLATCNPSLSAEWDFQKNFPLTPCDVFSKSGKKYFWLCPVGHSYAATVLHRSSGTNCPICNSGRQTSFAEQAIFYYIKKVFPDAISRYKDIFTNGMELDIFIPSIHLAIEYDGIFWHKAKSIKRDQLKYTICQKCGIYLIRVREEKVSSQNLADEILHMDNLTNQQNLEFLIRILLHQVISNPAVYSPQLHSTVDINLTRDSQEIRRYMTVIKDSLSTRYPNLAKQWHPSKNGSLTPSVFKCGSDHRAWWLCPTCGHEWQTSISHRVNGTGCPVCYRQQVKVHSPSAKKVYQFSKNGEFIKEWNCMSEASRSLSISLSNISMCIKGNRSHAGGYIWKDCKKF